jgi:beta-N-acetylhexosaminidase
MITSKSLFNFFVALLILIEISLIFTTIFIDFEELEEEETYFIDMDDPWADTILSQMSLEEKIGQLFLLELDDAKSDSKEEIDTILQSFHLNGVKFKQTEVLNQLIVTNYLQSKSKLPLFIGSEGSIVNRKDYNLPIGPIINSVKDSTFAEYYLQHFAEVLKLEGVNIEFTNSIDILDSINLTQGFTDSKQKIVKQSKLLRKLLHKNKIISCLNHNNKLFFNKDSVALDTLSLLKKPFEINKFFALLMPPEIRNTILEDETNYNFAAFNTRYYSFKGLVFTPIDTTIEMELLKVLFESGTDVFIIENDVEHQIKNFSELVQSGQINENEINKRVKRILLAKKWLKPEQESFKSAEISLSKIISKNTKLLSWKLYEASISLLKNKNNTLPFKNLLNNRTHLLVFGNDDFSVLKENLSYYMDFISSNYNKSKLNNASLSYSSNLILAIGPGTNVNFSDSLLIKPLEKLNETKNLIVLCFGRPDLIKKLDFADVLLYAYDQHPFCQANMAQVITGAVSPEGKILPGTLASGYTPPSFFKINRFRYTIPEAAGFNSFDFDKIDSLIEHAIYLGATPGAQILAAKKGKVFLYKSYGYQTYSKRQKVKNLDIYDLASITKVAATTLAAMKLYEQDSIHLEDSIKYYIEDTINCTIKNHQLLDFFIHKTGIPPDMPILQYISYQDSVTERFDKYYAEKKDSVHTIKVADNYFLREDYLDSIVASLYNLEIDTTKPYIYSDINFNIIYDILLRKLPVSYKKFVYSKFYNPLQLRTTCFLPLNRFNERRIAPTQKDRYWRKQLLRGTPHDESAALYGGIAGNAGLFSNANDLAILFQMLNHGGVYAGQKVFEKETIETFIYPPENSSRGLGFSRKNGGYYGHSGFTGCVVWANPQTDFIFVFLSNSIHPRATNRKLKRMKVRSQVLDLIWAAYQPEALKLNLAVLK